MCVNVRVHARLRGRSECGVSWTSSGFRSCIRSVMMSLFVLKYDAHSARLFSRLDCVRALKSGPDEASFGTLGGYISSPRVSPPFFLVSRVSAKVFSSGLSLQLSRVSGRRILHLPAESCHSVNPLHPNTSILGRISFHVCARTSQRRAAGHSLLNR